jgi:hypothetical protein
MKKIRFSEVWDRVEKYTIYVVLGLFAILQLLDSFMNSLIIDKILNSNTINLFIAIILMYLFLYVDKRLPLQSKFAKGIKIFDHFDEAVLYAISDIKNIRQIDIFAHSSDGYYSLLRHQFDNMMSLEKICLVIRNPDSESFLPHLKSDGARQYERNQIINRIESWMNLFRLEKWKNVKFSKSLPEIEVFEYDFDPPMNILIIDKKIVSFEFRKPTQEGWGFSSDKVFVVAKDDEVGAILANEVIDWFESTKNERTKKLPQSRPV